MSFASKSIVSDVAPTTQTTLDPLRYKNVIDGTDANSSHVHIINKIPDGARVLDVGCACGDLGTYLNYGKNCTVWGMEYCSESIELARATGAYEHVAQVDLNIFNDYHIYQELAFDRIVFGDVLEHLYSPEKVLRSFIPLLGNNGSMIVSLPNVAHGSISLQLLANKFVYMDYGILDRTHLRFFTSESIAQLFAGLGLEVRIATRTIWDLPGLHSYQPTKMAPSGVLGYIVAKPHSYVLQYVAEVVPSTQSPASLEKVNAKALCTFTEAERQRIEHFQSRLFPSSDNGQARQDMGSVPLGTRIRYSMPYFKSVLKKGMPRPVWNLLKGGRDVIRRARWRTLQGRVASSRLKCLLSFKAQVLQISAKTSSDFVDISERQAQPHPLCPKAIAFYLPQFHPFAENDAWWGRGFTEWTNVTKAMPMFVGHYQPQLPIDLGFYDLRAPEVMQRQIELAKLYGVYGFCFHYYWFSGKRLMERPILNYLANKDLDLPFCFCWANEPWSRRWDGSENELLIAQDLKPDDDRRFMEDLLPFLQDTRYITICGKPVLIIYRPHYWDKARVRKLTTNFRAVAEEHGLLGMYLICALSHDFQGDPRDWGFDAGVEFPPHMCGHVPQAKDLQVVNDDFCGTVHDMRALVDAENYMAPSAYTRYKTVFPAWDNTARKLNSAFIFHHCEPHVYKKWLKNIMQYTHQHNSQQEQFVFINAWNEWAEGAHLEPDRRYGYAFLQATAEALEEFIP
ncbi:glycoside hydrolase family 99-like domain-containing protein [Nitratidesulfovibrio sp. 1201_IL3209]|uniref:glycoside hydrolase family 99-like domain-containing protein n=1 Tax=Nitratidesulfovibrio sp. 1201_IL3209 TaxID=3084053 RepID=UPI002FDA1242